MSRKDGGRSGRCHQHLSTLILHGGDVWLFVSSELSYPAKTREIKGWIRPLRLKLNMMLRGCSVHSRVTLVSGSLLAPPSSAVKVILRATHDEISPAVMA